MKADEDRRSRVATANADGTAEIVCAFEDNRLAMLLFGQHDQNLSFIERRLSVEATARGNHVAIRGQRDACEHAKRVLDLLYQRLRSGQSLSLGDVDGAIRMTLAQGKIGRAHV